MYACLSQTYVKDCLPVPAIEEMLIALEQLFLQSFRVNGEQTKYPGHICLHLNDNSRFIQRLPRAISELDVLVVKCKPNDDDPPNRNFSNRPEFQVNRTRLPSHLFILKRYNPEYRDIAIDEAALSALPENGSDYRQLQSVTMEDLDRKEEVGSSESEGMEEANCNIVSESGALDLGQPWRISDDIREMINEFREQLESSPNSLIVLLALRPYAQPIFDQEASSYHYLRAFPTLFPTGAADPFRQRNHVIALNEQFKHFMRYKDGRSATHPRFH